MAGVSAATEPERAPLDVEALHREHWPALWRLALLLTSDPAVAEDVVQDAFARLLRITGRRGRGPAPGAELAYLRRSVVNLANSRWRRLAVARRHAPALVGPESVAAVDDTDVDAEPDAGRRAAAVRAAVADLPARQRTCVVLHYFEGLTDTAVAEALGISPGSVKAHLHRARATLTARLEDQR